MTTTVQQLADASLFKIVVAGSEASLEADDIADFITALNNYMAMLDSIGVTLGYTAVSSASDNLTVPAGAIDPLVAVMAVKISPQYGGVVSPELAMEAKEGLNVLRILGNSFRNTKYPETLPVGSGNYWPLGYNYYDGTAP